MDRLFFLQQKRKRSGKTSDDATEDTISHALFHHTAHSSSLRKVKLTMTKPAEEAEINEESSYEDLKGDVNKDVTYEEVHHVTWRERIIGDPERYKYSALCIPTYPW